MKNRTCFVLTHLVVWGMFGAACGGDATGSSTASTTLAATTTSTPSTTIERSVATTPTIPTTTTTQGPIEIQYVFEPGVSAADQEVIRQGIEVGRTYVSERFAPLRQPLTVYVYNSAPADKSVAGVYGPDSHIEIYTLNSDWTRETRSVVRMKIMAHEYFHVMQSQLSGPFEKLPIWLTEGSAEYVGYSAVIHAGLVSREGALSLSRLTGGPRSLTRAPPLQGLETPTQWQAALSTAEIYPLGYAAIELLLESNSESRLSEYFEGLRASRSDWRPLFERTFGRSAEAFYGEMSSARA